MCDERFSTIHTVKNSYEYILPVDNSQRELVSWGVLINLMSFMGSAADTFVHGILGKVCGWMSYFYTLKSSEKLQNKVIDFPTWTLSIMMWIILSDIPSPRIETTFSNGFEPPTLFCPKFGLQTVLKGIFRPNLKKKLSEILCVFGSPEAWVGWVWGLVGACLRLGFQATRLVYSTACGDLRPPYGCDPQDGKLPGNQSTR